MKGRALVTLDDYKQALYAAHGELTDAERERDEAVVLLRNLSIAGTQGDTSGLMACAYQARELLESWNRREADRRLSRLDARKGGE